MEHDHCYSRVLADDDEYSQNFDSFLSQQIELCDSVESSVVSHNWLSGSQTEHTPVPCTTNDSNADDAGTAVEKVTVGILK